MSTPSDPEKTITAPSLHTDGEKAADKPRPIGVEAEEKEIDYITTPSTSPAPPAEAHNHYKSLVLAAKSPQGFADTFADAPQPLPFSCWDHKLSIGVFWFFILAEVCFIPESFYYGLWFGTTLNHGACKLRMQ